MEDLDLLEELRRKAFEANDKPPAEDVPLPGLMDPSEEVRGGTDPLLRLLRRPRVHPGIGLFIAAPPHTHAAAAMLCGHLPDLESPPARRTRWSSFCSLPTSSAASSGTSASRAAPRTSASCSGPSRTRPLAGAPGSGRRWTRSTTRCGILGSLLAAAARPPRLPFPRTRSELLPPA